MALVVAVDEDIVATVSTDYLVAQIAGHAFGPGVPEDNFAVRIDQVDAHRQGIEDGATNLRIIQG